MDIPTLDTTVSRALEFLKGATLRFPEVPFAHPLVIGSGNAIETGRIAFRDSAAYVASETTYLDVLDRYEPDGAVLVSASGGKHATGIAEALSVRGLKTILLTHTSNSPAEAFVGSEHTYVFPKCSEPYAYNTVTYMGIIAAKEKAPISDIQAFLDHLATDALVRSRAYTLVLPSAYALLVPMLRTKFDELFGGSLMCRVFVEEDLKHAKTIIRVPDELFIVCDSASDAILYDDAKRIHIPLMAGSYTAALATTYTIVGKIQRLHDPVFAQNIEAYTARASEVFHQNIKPIVD